MSSYHPNEVKVCDDVDWRCTSPYVLQVVLFLTCTPCCWPASRCSLKWRRKECHLFPDWWPSRQSTYVSLGLRLQSQTIYIFHWHISSQRLSVSPSAWKDIWRDVQSTNHLNTRVVSWILVFWYFPPCDLIFHYISRLFVGRLEPLLNQKRCSSARHRDRECDLHQSRRKVKHCCFNWRASNVKTLRFLIQNFTNDTKVLSKKKKGLEVLYTQGSGF